MKNYLFVLFLSIYSISAVSQTKNSTFPEAGFIADFPTSTIPETTKSEMKYGNIETTAYSYEGEEFLIILSENIYPANLIFKLKEKGTDGLLDGSRNGAIKNLELQTGEKIVLTFDEKFMHDNKYPAIKFGGSSSDAQMESLCILKDNHFFILMTIGNSESPEVVKFMKSFKIL
ncbi:MAG: hypothetical protein ACI9XR_002171 [Flavobacterium sp.]|jgi:hypothetical protein